MEFTEMKEHFEKKHIPVKESGSMEDLPVGKQTFIHHNRKTINEFN